MFMEAISQYQLATVSKATKEVKPHINMIHIPIIN